MSKVTLKPETTVVVATGEQAKLFSITDADPSAGFTLEFERGLTPQNLEDDGPAGKQPPDSDKQELDEATFSKQLADFLFKRVHAGKMGDIVMIADPQTLGELRAIIHQEVENQIVAEIPKTLINAPTSDIEATLLRELG